MFALFSIVRYQVMTNPSHQPPASPDRHILIQVCSSRKCRARAKETVLVELSQKTGIDVNSLMMHHCHAIVDDPELSSPVQVSICDAFCLGHCDSPPVARVSEFKGGVAKGYDGIDCPNATLKTVIEAIGKLPAKQTS